MRDGVIIGVLAISLTGSEDVLLIGLLFVICFAEVIFLEATVWVVFLGVYFTTCTVE